MVTNHKMHTQRNTLHFKTKNTNDDYKIRNYVARTYVLVQTICRSRNGDDGRFTDQEAEMMETMDYLQIWKTELKS